MPHTNSENPRSVLFPYNSTKKDKLSSQNFFVISKDEISSNNFLVNSTNYDEFIKNIEHFTLEEIKKFFKEVFSIYPSNSTHDSNDILKKDDESQNAHSRFMVLSACVLLIKYGYTNNNSKVHNHIDALIKSILVNKKKSYTFTDKNGTVIDKIKNINLVYNINIHKEVTDKNLYDNIYQYIENISQLNNINIELYTDSDTDSEYHNKYLKYKHKYLNLKKKLNNLQL